MRKLLLFMLFAVCGYAAQAQSTKINPTTLIKAGAVNTVLNTSASGVVDWVALNTVFSGGTGISVSSSGVITNTSPNQTVSLTGAGILAVTGSYPNFTLTANELDGSATNEGSLTVGGAGATRTITSNTSGSTAVSLTAGTGVGISHAGNVITLVNSSPDQTVSLTGGSGITTSGTYPNFNITASDISNTNEAQALGVSGTTSGVITLAAANGVGGGSATIAAGTGITVAQSSGTITIAATATSPTWTLEKFEAVTGSTVTTTASLPSSPNALFVERSGVMMVEGTGEDYTKSGNIITFTTALASERVIVRWMN